MRIVNYLFPTMFIFLLACGDNEKPPPLKQKENKTYHNLSLRFKEGASRNYLGATSLQLDTIELTGLAEDYHKSLMKFTDYQGLKRAAIKYAQRTRITIKAVKPGGSAIVHGYPQKVSIQEISVNDKVRKVPLPHNLPTDSSTKPVIIELSNKKELKSLPETEKLPAQSGIESGLMSAIIKQVNRYQRLPDAGVHRGEKWTIPVKAELPFDKTFENGGMMKLNLTFINRLLDFKDNLITLSHSYSGSISIEAGTAYGKVQLRITVKGKGQTVLDSAIGMEQSANMETDFSLTGSLSPIWKHAQQLGKPRLKVRGRVSYDLAPVVDG